jgi:hypothetical protein
MTSRKEIAADLERASTLADALERASTLADALADAHNARNAAYNARCLVQDTSTVPADWEAAQDAYDVADAAYTAALDAMPASYFTG